MPFSRLGCSPVTAHAPLAADTMRHPRGAAAPSNAASKRSTTESPVKRMTGTPGLGGGTIVAEMDVEATTSMTSGAAARTMIGSQRRLIRVRRAPRRPIRMGRSIA